MYKLYARNNTGSAAVEALLELLGVSYERVDVPKTEAAKAPDWYYAINPRGEVPTLELSDGSVMTESAAMMMYLADAHPEKGLAPAVGQAARAHYLRWMVYLAATPYATDLRLYYPERYSTDAAHAAAIKTKAAADLARDFEVLAKGINEGPFTLGKAMSCVDVYAAMLLNWSDDPAVQFAREPKLKSLYAATVAHPVVRKVWLRNGMSVVD